MVYRENCTDLNVTRTTECGRQVQELVVVINDEAFPACMNCRGGDTAHYVEQVRDKSIYCQ